MKHIAYISSPYFADCDLPLLQELRQIADVDYYLVIGKSSQQATLINLEVKPEGDVFPATAYPELKRLEEFTDLNKVFVINMPKGHDWSPQNLKAVWSAVQFIKNRQYDVVHATYPFRYGSFAFYRLRKKMLMTMHDPIPHSSDMGWLNRFHRWVAFRLVNHFLVLSHSIKAEFISRYHLEKKHVYESRLSIFTHLQQTTPADFSQHGYVLFVGSINLHKGIEYLCEAVLKVAEKHPGIKLIIAGRGKFYFDVGKYLQSGVIEVINRFITDNELTALIRQSAMVVCPYVDATQSGVVMSAFSLQKPVVATMVGGIPEMFTDHVHGLLVPPRDSQSLATAIETLLTNPGMLEQMKANIRGDYSQGNRSWKFIAQEYADIYQEITMQR